MNQIATIKEGIDALPTRLEILESNTDEDIKQFEFEIAQHLTQIEEASNESMAEVEQLNKRRSELLNLSNIRKANHREIEQGNKVKVFPKLMLHD